VMDILRVHPVVIVGGVLQENPFFVPPEQFLLELQERKLASKWLNLSTLMPDENLRLRAASGHNDAAQRCPLSGVKRT